MQKQNDLIGLQQLEKDQKDNLLSQNTLELQVKETQLRTVNYSQKMIATSEQKEEILDPIQQIIKKNNIMPLLAVIDKIDLNRKIQDKPLLSLLATKFLPLDIILADKQITFTLDDDRRSPLHYAIEANDVKAAAWLISKNHPNQQDNFGNTPILDAIRLGRRRCFLLCLQNKLFDERAPIYAAMYNKHWELKVMYGLKIDIFSYRDEQNKSAFQKSLQYCSFDCAEFMIKLRPNLRLLDYRHLTQSQGVMRRLSKVQKSMQIGQRMKDLFRPLYIIIFLLVGLFTNILGFNQDQLYQRTKPFYLILILLIVALYGFRYIVGTVGKSKVQNKQKNKLSQLLSQPNYKTLEEICPVCTHLTNYNYDHCYSCGCCVEKYHFHSFVCVNKSNQVFWVVGQFIWLYLSWSILNEFVQFLSWKSIQISSISSFTFIKFLNLIEILVQKNNFSSLIWIGFLSFLFLYQMFYCLSLIGMMAMRRTFQQVIHSQKYLHLYQIIKVQDNFMNKEMKIFQRGFLGGFKRCIRNIFVYFFIRG